MKKVVDLFVERVHNSISPLGSGFQKFLSWCGGLVAGFFLAGITVLLQVKSERKREEIQLELIENDQFFSLQIIVFINLGARFF